MKFFGSLLVFTGAICFSTKAILVKLAYQFPVDAISLLNLRMLFSLPFFLIIGIYSGRKEQKVVISRQDWIKIVLLGMVGYYLASLLDFMGLQYITAGLERLILFIYPTIVVIISAVVYKKPISKLQYLALLLSYAGIFLAFVFDTNLEGNKNIVLGSILVFFCAIAYAVFIFGSGKLIPRVGTLRFTAYAMSFSAFAIIIHAFITKGIDVYSFNSEVYLLSMLMAILATVIPSFLISEGIRIIGSDNASIVSSIGPVSTIILAYIFLGEEISGMQILGTLCVLTGVLLISLKKPAKEIS